jgi:hypothetical protein
MTSPALLAPLASLLLAAPVLSAPGPAAPPFNPDPPQACAFTLLVDRSGMHQLRYESLQEAAAAEEPKIALAKLRSGELQLSHLGKTVPIWVADGGDGVFGPGDHLEFLGEPPRGERSAYDEQVRFNAYRLAGCAPAPAGARHQRAALPAELPPVRELARVADHLEQDKLFLRFQKWGFGDDPPERWYWAKLTQIDHAPFSLPIDLRSYDPALGKLSLKLDLRGWSYGSGKKVQAKDHQLEVLWNGRSLGTWESDGQYRLQVDIPELPADRIVAGKNTLGLKVPARTGSDGNQIIDVMMLNWVELEFPRRRRLEADQQLVMLAERDGPSTMVFSTQEKGELLVYDDKGRRWDSRSYQREQGADGLVRYKLAVPPDSRSLRTVAGGAFREAARVEVDLPSQLRSTGNRADYLMIVHPSLRQALEPLAELHRKRGLTVDVVDVRDIYEEYSFGLRRPEAIRDFIKDAWHNWQPPKPRWVLLVGDASWDSRNEEVADQNYADWTYQPGESLQFVKNSSTPYADAGKKSRDLIPAHTYETYQGHAASDNFYACVDGEDIQPDLAIGRLPIVEKEELAAIVGKIEKYLQTEAAATPADWQKRALFIANQEVIYQNASDKIAKEVEGELEIEKVYPQAETSNNKASVEALHKAFNEGQLLVHFIGHGGRYIWRTGPEDLHRNNDLFTLKDLDQLTPTEGYPFVMSMTCYSAPFDHPTADSIGEKLLRLSDKGAIAVLAAAWRNSPSTPFSTEILQQLQVPGKTIGEAVLAGKRKEQMDHDSIQQYNLLGDPALPLALPAQAPVQTAVKQPHPEWLRNRIKWQTASEVDNFGYDIYRGRAEEGPFEKVTKNPLPGNGTTDEPSEYEYFDEDILENTEYWYYVESISIQGVREKFTPVFKAKPKTKPAEENKPSS